MTTPNRGLVNTVENTNQPGVAHNWLADVVDRLYGALEIDFASDAALELTQVQADYQVIVLNDTGPVLTGPVDVVFPAGFPMKLVVNNTAEDLTLKKDGETGFTLAASESAVVACGADDVIEVSTAGGGASYSDAMTIITEASAFTADPATHAGRSRYIRAADDVTFDDAEGYTAGETYNIRATAAIDLVEDGVTLTPPSGGTLALATGMAVTIIMTSSTAGDVIGQTVPA